MFTGSNKIAGNWQVCVQCISMQKIGEGFYYQVYDLGNGRVLKKVNSHSVMLKKLLLWYGVTPWKKVRQVFVYPYTFYCIRQSLKLSARIARYNPDITGNPVFGPRYEYEQDKAEILEEYFEKHSLDQNKRIFDQFILLLKHLWTQAFADTVYNCTINNGISIKTGQLIYIDFNECTTRKERIINDIKSQKWCTQSSLLHMPPGELKDYILEKMESEITIPELERLWNSAGKQKKPSK